MDVAMFRKAANSGMSTSANAVIGSFDADRFSRPVTYQWEGLCEVCDHKFPYRPWRCFPNRNGVFGTKGDDFWDAGIHP